MIGVLNFFAGIHKYVTAALAAICVALAVGWHITDLKLDAERAGRQTDRKSYELAQEKATAIALAEKQRIENEYSQFAKKANADYDALNAQYRSTLLRYQTAQRQASRSNLPGPASDTGLYEGVGEGAELSLPADILISFEDATVCAENTAKLQSVKEYLDALEAWKLKEGYRSEHPDRD